MEQHQSPLRSGRRLTPQLFDEYVERARAERAKAIAEFGSRLIARLTGLARRLAGRGRRGRSRAGAKVRTVR